MIKNGVYILKQDTSPIKDVNFKANQEIEVVGNVIYVNGFPLPFEMQETLNNWIKEGLIQGIFINDTRNYGR
jgi:hypothetical protein